jgi:ATP-binding cassette subfamily B protein
MTTTKLKWEQSCHKTGPTYTPGLLDRVTTSEVNSFISKCLPPALLLIILGFLITLVWRFYNYLVFKSLPRIKADIVTIATEHLRNPSNAFFQERLSGDITVKI